MNRIIAGLGAITLVAGLAGGLAGSASASTLPIYGTITGLHSITLDTGFAALRGEIIRPVAGYSSTVTVTSVSGQNIITNGVFLPTNTHGAEVAFAVVGDPEPAPMTIAITGITSSQVGTSASDDMTITTTPAHGIPLETFMDGVLASSPAVVAGGSTHVYTIELVDPGNIVVATSAPVTATAKFFAPPLTPLQVWEQNYGNAENAAISADIAIVKADINADVADGATAYPTGSTQIADQLKLANDIVTAFANPFPPLVIPAGQVNWWASGMTVLQAVAHSANGDNIPANAQPDLAYSIWAVAESGVEY